MTASKGGSDLTASSNAPSCAMSSTIAKSSCSLEYFGCAFFILSALSCDLTVVTTECLQPMPQRRALLCAVTLLTRAPEGCQGRERQ